MLFAITMDYLVIQAMSVPCERVFLLAKETDTTKQNQISPMLMEALQTLKFILKKKRLNFIKGWATPLAAMSEGSKSGLNLGSLFKGDSDAAMDNILKDFCTYD